MLAEQCFVLSDAFEWQRLIEPSGFNASLEKIECLKMLQWIVVKIPIQWILNGKQRADFGENVMNL